jgi:methionyl-tRNA formyltransferase
MKKKFNKILLLGRKNDHSVSLLIKFLKKNSNKLVVVWSKHPKEKIKFSDYVLKSKFDYIVSFRNFYIFKKNLIKNVKYAAINFHPSTPNYRGMGCVNYALFNNKKFYGSTAHLIDEKIDHGKIINVRRFKIKKEYSLQSLLNKTHSNMLTQAIKIFISLKKDPGNLKKMILKSKNEKWSKKVSNRKKMEKFYETENFISYKNLLRKIRACYMKDFRPYIMIHGFKFSLYSPFAENVHSKHTDKKKYKMYFDFIPKDLTDEYNKN